MQTILNPFKSDKLIDCSEKYNHIYKNLIKTCTPSFVFADNNGEYIQHTKEYYIEAKKALTLFEFKLNHILNYMDSN